MEVVLLTDGALPHYNISLSNALATHGVTVYIVAGDDYLKYKVQRGVNIINFRGAKSGNRPWYAKVINILRYYTKLIKFALQTDIRIFHIQWYRSYILDTVVLNSFYKLIGKRLVYTAHDIYPHGKKENRYFRLLYGYVYHCLCDVIICHNQYSRHVLEEDFRIPGGKIRVIPHGLISVVPDTGLDHKTAQRQLFGQNFVRVPTLLFFGWIKKYKGLEYLIDACATLTAWGEEYSLVIAGAFGEGDEYRNMIMKKIHTLIPADQVHLYLRHVEDEEVECILKAADVLILPYSAIYQSGVLSLAYHFGIPIIATNVGSFHEDVIEAKTGYVVPPCNSLELAQGIKRFKDEMLPNLEFVSEFINDYSKSKFSWAGIAEKTIQSYQFALNMK